MTINDRITAFSLTAQLILKFINNEEINKDYFPFKTKFDKLIQTEKYKNPWFTENNIILSLTAICNDLSKQNLSKWLSKYTKIPTESTNKTVGVLMAGNIPMVGFHDMLCVLISGHNFQAKLYQSIIMKKLLG